jgi:protein-tyrosine phosphatase
MQEMIDIHCHLIPEFDDGPKSYDESLDMLRQAADQGIRQVFATSHFNEWIPIQIETEYFNKLTELREKVTAKNIRVTIHSGAEIFYHHYVENTVKASKVTTLGNWGQYVLIEFPMFQMPEGAEDVLFRLTAEKYIPVIAHPERYAVIIDRPRRIENFIKFGGILQLNGGSVLGHFGKEIQKLALLLLENQWIHFIASDAHAPNGRTFILRKVYEHLKDKLPEDYLQNVLYNYQKKIVDQLILEPVKLPEEQEKSGLFQQIKRHFKPST